MLRVSLIGNLGVEPETRYNQKGSQITTFRVAVNQLRTDADGERQESTEWFRVRAMGRLAECRWSGGWTSPTISPATASLAWVLRSGRMRWSTWPVGWPKATASWRALLSVAIPRQLMTR